MKININKGQFFLYLLILPGLIFFLPPSDSEAQNPDFGYKVNYRNAVPAFLNEVTGAVEDVENKEEIAGWADEASLRISEFLNDQIEAMREISEQQWPHYNNQPVKEFLVKWQQIIDTCPECEDLSLLVEPLAEKLFEGLPPLRATRPGDVPFQNIYELFNQLEAFNPWGLAALFQLPFLNKEIYELKIKELEREAREKGVEKRFIVSREVIEKRNNEVIFYELINDDKVENVDYPVNEVTFLHKALAYLIQDNWYPRAIAFWKEVVSTMEEKLFEAWQDGVLDDFTYFYFYNQEPIRNEVIHLVHPLLKSPYIKEYKVAEFYPRAFSGEPWLDQENMQNLTAENSPLVKGSFSSVKQAEYNPPQPSEDYSKASEKVAAFWLVGIISPMYLFMIISIIRSFLF